MTPKPSSMPQSISTERSGTPRVADTKSANPQPRPVKPAGSLTYTITKGANAFPSFKK